MRVDKKFLANVGLIVLAVAVVVGIQAFHGVSTVQAKADKDCVCHAAGHGQSHDTPTQYICLHPSVNAVTQNDNGGHLNEDSTHGPEHAPDFLCSDCSECDAASVPSPTPTPTPSPSPK